MTRTILIVEDTELGRDSLELALMQVPGLTVRSVASAEEALTCLATSEVCALVTDIHLPGMDGFELIEAIRSRHGNAVLPILVVSGDSDPQTPAKLAKLGANAYFPKPYSPAEIRHRLEQLINGHN